MAGEAVQTEAAPDLAGQFGDWAAQDFGLDEPKENAKPEGAEVEEQPADVAEPAENAPPESETAESALELTVSSLSDLAKELGVPVEAVLKLQYETDVNGQKAAKPLSEIIKGYQLDQHNNQKSQELSRQMEQAKALEAHYQQTLQAQQQHVQQLTAMGQYAAEMLNQEFGGVDWAQLQRDDPLGYTMTRQAFQDRQTQIQNYMQQVNVLSQQQQAQAQQRQQAQMQTAVAEARSQRPGWTDNATFDKDCGTIRNVLLEHGFKQEELPVLLTNPAYLLVADAAAQWWNLQKQKPEAVARVKAAPKLVRPGVRSGSAKTQMQNLKDRLKANPDNQDLAAAAFGQFAEDANLL